MYLLYRLRRQKWSTVMWLKLANAVVALLLLLSAGFCALVGFSTLHAYIPESARMSILLGSVALIIACIFGMKYALTKPTWWLPAVIAGAGIAALFLALWR